MRRTHSVSIDTPGKARFHNRALTRSPAVLRASAVLAIAGGGLRLANSFTTDVLPGSTLAMLYLVTDVLLLAGIAGIWSRRRGTLGPAATAGIVIFIAGTLTIRAAAFGVLGTAGYLIGATIALLGLAAYSIETLLRRGAAPWAPAPVLWLVALACAIVGAVGVAPPVLTVAAGVALGAGFVAAGVEMLRRGYGTETRTGVVPVAGPERLEPDTDRAEVSALDRPELGVANLRASLERAAATRR